jgi:hypothetical protein
MEQYIGIMMEGGKVVEVGCRRSWNEGLDGCIEIFTGRVICDVSADEELRFIWVDQDERYRRSIQSFIH